MLNWNACKPLSTEDLKVTVALAVKGNAQATEKIIKANVKLASKIAHNYSSFGGMDVEDLTSEAIIGLIEAIPYFDEKKGVKFTTYATWHMRKRVLAYVIDNFRLVKIGTTQAQRKIFWRLTRETRALQKEGLTATEQALADRLQVKVTEIREMRLRMSGEASFDATDPHDSTGQSLFDTTANDDPSPEEYTSRKIMIEWVQAKMIEFEQRLTATEQTVWNYRIVSNEPETMERVSDRINATKQYVSLTQKRLQKAFEKFARNRARD